MNKRVAMVTGASSGIGATFARRLARDGYGLILVARRGDRLEALAREIGGAETIAADLTTEDGLARVEQRIEAGLDLLVNNAGFGTKGKFYETPFAGQEAMHRLHVMATMRLTRAALATMIPRGRGGVINVSSVAAYGQSPGNVSYCATKAWMNSFTEGLDLELKSAGSPVRVQALCPGFTTTEFHDTMGMSRDGIPGWLWMRAEDVVDASLRGLERGKVFVVPGAIYKMIVRLETLVPRWIRSAAVVAAGRRKRARGIL
jgi:short-subunit dehydrogenase